ncbi:hypothetical protein ACFL1H_01065 [Nanoarchaeota archaeon]
MNEEELFSKAIKEWGVHPQLDMCIEEMAELIKEINKWKRNWSEHQGNVPHSIIEEYVDVKIMLKQLEIYCRNSDVNFDNLVQVKKNEKIERIKNKLNLF